MGLGSAQFRYVILAPEYDERSGGSIALHQLCHQLNSLGETAVLWPQKWLRTENSKGAFKRWRRRLKDRVSPPDFRRHSGLDTPLSRKRRLSDHDIVIYPEVIAGNPLGGKHVVRWLLHRPGFHTGVIEYGAGDLFFKFADFAEDFAVTRSSAPQLFVFTINDCYRNEGGEDRRGSCYLIRKGEGKELVHQLDGSVQIDGLSHEEVAAIFNRCETFYSYDESTMYSCYAAMCGCTSVVIPGEYATRQEWIAKNLAFRYGIAFGEEDIGHARATRDSVLPLLRELEKDSVETVRRFVGLTQQHFGQHSDGRA